VGPAGHTAATDGDRAFLDVYFRSLEEFRQEVRTNIQHGGMFLEADQTFQDAKEVFIRVHLPNTFRQVLLKGAVVFTQLRENEKLGLGLQLDTTPESLAALAKI